MARTKSVILTPAEKRSALADLKNRIKEFNKDQKANARAMTAATKDYDKAMKSFQRAASSLDTNISKLVAQQEALQAAAA